MNLILFDLSEINSQTGEILLHPQDGRAIHIRQILKASPGESIDAGIINGRKGKAVLKSVDNRGTSLILTANEEPEGPHPLSLLLGLSRPPTVKKVLKEASALGIERFILCGTENGERSYRQSSALKPEKIRDVLLEGIQQACCTVLPEVDIRWSVKNAVESINNDKGTTMPRLIALDNYEAETSLSGYWRHAEACSRPVILAVGSERGWTGTERQVLREAGFILCSLGSRVLRTETASIAGAAVCLSGMGLV